MKNIVLLCNAGMSTSMMVKKMREAAENQGFECNINAYPLSDLDTVAVDADVILLGPQVRFELNKVKNACPNIPVEAISSMDYGMLKGDNVLEAAKKLMEE